MASMASMTIGCPSLSLLPLDLLLKGESIIDTSAVTKRELQEPDTLRLMGVGVGVDDFAVGSDTLVDLI